MLVGGFVAVMCVVLEFMILGLNLKIIFEQIYLT